MSTSAIISRSSFAMKGWRSRVRALDPSASGSRPEESIAMSA